MKTKKLSIITALVIIMLLLMPPVAKTQTISDFETPVLPADTFWNGSDGSGGFANGNAWFNNKFTDWGGGFTSWGGFSYSSMRDTLTQSFTNDLSAISCFGFNNSQQYAVCYVSVFDPLPVIRLTGIAQNDSVSGLYITNSTYGYLTMKNGDFATKKFGGADGTDPDWFTVAIYGYKDGMKKADSVLFYLADFRSADSTEDYIVKTWEWVDLKILGKVDSLEFNMFSTDTVGGFGINNPTYFCIDNLITNHNSFASVKENISEQILIYPNPANDFIYVKNIPVDKQATIFVNDIYGKIVFIIPVNESFAYLDIRHLSPGIYTIICNGLCAKFLKK
ncbi:MAG: DUF4465 domain-containing protein [Bacteroidales bacterium]|jgi:hypothetical protein|nr:DUF4465 domain-containing protein [Bacteroidales bacterium]MDD4214376.1 DUF4465 domain-containing protein [Bacteroidales bacterium]